MKFEEIIKKIRKDESFAWQLKMFETEYGSITDSIEELPFGDYLNAFEYLPYQLSSSIQPFDHILLLKLIAASFSSEYNLIFNKQDSEIPELVLRVSSGGRNSTARISTLNYDQIFSLFFIYIKEQIGSQVFLIENPKDLSLISNRFERVNIWYAKLGEAKTQIKSIVESNKIRKLLN